MFVSLDMFCYFAIIYALFKLQFEVGSLTYTRHVLAVVYTNAALLLSNSTYQVPQTGANTSDVMDYSALNAVKYQIFLYYFLNKYVATIHEESFY